MSAAATLADAEGRHPWNGAHRPRPNTEYGKPGLSAPRKRAGNTDRTSAGPTPGRPCVFRPGSL